MSSWSRRDGKSDKSPVPSIQFIRVGEKPHSSKKTKKSLLQEAQIMGRKLCFPQIVRTSLRPDVVIRSEDGRRIIMIQASERKSTKYHDPVQQCRDKAWKAWLVPIKVGCRGMCGRFFKALGITGSPAGSGIGGRTREAGRR